MWMMQQLKRLRSNMKPDTKYLEPFTKSSVIISVVKNNLMQSVMKMLTQEGETKDLGEVYFDV